MPSAIYEDVLTGEGAAILGGTRVFYVAWEVTVSGIRVRNGSESDPDALMGVGYFALGNDLTPLGLISGVGWQEAHWFNWTIGQWIPSPAMVGSDFSNDIAQYIHWAISAGSEVHLYVFGDI